MPAIITLDDQVTFVTDPVNPCAGADFTVSWREKNVGDEKSDDYQDIFDLDDQGSGDSRSIPCTPLAAGDSVLRSAVFNLPAGNYTMSLVVNGQGPVSLGNVVISDCA
ncbi:MULTISPECIES: hypothetical protein [unclassified Streptomyces]|uniref:hypothetical protein n=1 Tax=unclassified Streptomyces TaxID=2593676 RepID=UPI0029BB4890|nr:hypothetical protein [Streptomyces sp. FL07-04A]MDX3576839.1 hypothetical protein [Streptomyces sp. FL07-04A]